MFYLLESNAMSWNSCLTALFIPPLLGNIIGGVSLVAALGHAQMVGGKE
jgi:formate-nitrite transporter family protein